MVGVSADGRIIHRPGTVLTGAALVSATASVALTGSSSAPALVAGVVGALGLAIGLTRGDPGIAALGAIALLAGVLAAGAVGAPPEQVLPATATALLAWEFGFGALGTTDELHGGTTERTEALHVAIAAGVGAVATGATYTLYQVLEFGISPLGVVLLLVATVALGIALRE